MPFEEKEAPKKFHLVVKAEPVPGFDKFRLVMDCGHCWVFEESLGDSLKQYRVPSARGIYRKCWICTEDE